MLNECSYLRLDDILPALPDTVRIGDFRTELLSTLDTFNSNIKALKDEMDVYTESAALIRQDIAALRHRSCVVPEDRQCDLCEKPLVSRAFYLFPCSHAFHTTCARKHVEMVLEENKRLGRIVWSYW